MSKKKIRLTVAIATIIILVCVLYFFQSGLLGFWTDGIVYIANSTDKYTCTYEKIDDTYAVDISLSDLEKNKGKILYEDGKYKIIVDWVDNTENVNQGGYRIGFKAIGVASINGAELIISGVKHTYIEGEGFNNSLTSKATARYNQYNYECEIYGEGPFAKDGDCFSFYIFPHSAYESGNITLKEQGVVTLTISDLCKNIWSKK